MEAFTSLMSLLRPAINMFISIFLIIARVARSFCARRKNRVQIHRRFYVLMVETPLRLQLPGFKLGPPPGLDCETVGEARLPCHKWT